MDRQLIMALILAGITVALGSAGAAVALLGDRVPLGMSLCATGIAVSVIGLATIPN